MKEKIDRLAPTIFDETTGIRYNLHGDYYFPNLLDPEQENAEPIGKWGLMRQKYLQENHPGLFSRLLLSGKLEDPMRWVGLMNNARAEAETNVITEIVCC